MADGLTDANANSALTTWTASALWAQLHTGPPGPAGTANVSSVAARQPVSWNAPAGGVITAANQPVWSNWAGTDGEKVTDVSFWSAVSGGTFQFSMTLGAPAGGVAPGVVMHVNDTLNLTPLTLTLPEAA